MNDASEMIARIDGPQQPDRQGLDGYCLSDLLSRFRVPGMSVAVIDNFEIAFERSWGIADIVTGTPATSRTLFQACSISKPVAAMVSLKAIERGAFGLDDDINDVLSSWKLPSGGFADERFVTPRMLMSHTSGLGDGFGFPGYHPSEPLPTIVQTLDGLPPSNRKPVRLERPPFTAYKYSGGGTILQQQALTDALNRSFSQLAHEFVLDPIGMHDSGFEQPLSPERDANAARGHDGRGRSMNSKWRIFIEQAAAGLWTTAGDLAKFALEVQTTLAGFGNRVLSKAMMQEMVTPVGIGPFAIGFRTEQRGEGWYFWHGGDSPGYACMLLAHRAKGYGVAVMTNGDNAEKLIHEVVDRVQRAYGWDSLDKPIFRTFGSFEYSPE